MSRAVGLIDRECTVDFIDINMGCPIDMVVNKSAGSALLNKPLRMKNIVEVSSSIVETPITIKVTTLSIYRNLLIARCIGVLTSLYLPSPFWVPGTNCIF